MNAIPIQEAWTTVAMGLHIHRHFLEVVPRLRERRGDVMFRRFSGRLRDGGVPDPDKLRAVYPDSFLEHCLGQERSLAGIADSFSYDEICTSFANEPVLIVDENDCITRNGPYPVIDVSRLPAAAKNSFTEGQDRVGRLVCASGLQYLVNLNVDILIASHRSTADAAARYAVDHPRLLYKTHLVGTSDDAVDQASDVLASAASHWMYGFIMARLDPANPESKTWSSPWSGRPTDSISYLTEIFAHCMRLFFCERIVARFGGSLSTGEKRTCEAITAYERSLLPRAEEMVYSIDTHFRNPDREEQVKYNNMNVFDLVSTFYPGARRYEKYQQGLGAGQAGQERLTRKK